MVDYVRRIRLRARLSAAAQMLQGFDTVADIGCDHGRLICSLLQQNAGMRGIAADINAAPLARAKRLAETVGVMERLSFRRGDGLSVLLPNEADAVALLGMGGSVMVQILSACQTPLAGAQRAVLQPMRAVADIRLWLYQNGYAIERDVVVSDAGRLYQVFTASPARDGAPDPFPAGWPPDCFDIGYRAYQSGDTLLPALAKQMLQQHEKRLLTARGTRGAALLETKRAQMQTVLHLMGERV